MTARNNKEGGVDTIAGDSRAGENVQLLMPFIEVDNLRNLAYAYHFDADWYRKIALRWTRAGVALLVFSILSLLAINVTARRLQLEPEVWIALNATACVVILYSVQLIGKQIVATREMIYAYGERARLIQVMDCATSLLETKKERGEAIHAILSILASRVPSPFETEKVAGSASYDFLKDFSGLIHGKKNDGG